MKVLVVDDEFVQRQLLKKMLVSWDHEVLEAEDGDKAWKILRENQDLNVLVSDWMMPGLEGPELCAAVRSEPRDSYLFIMMVTSRSGATSFASGMAAGADAYLTKPIDFKALEGRMQAAERVIKRENELGKKVLGALREAGQDDPQSMNQVARALDEDVRDVERTLERYFMTGEVMRDETKRYIACKAS
jgi:DNA-binding response OmpR family regulator